MKRRIAASLVAVLLAVGAVYPVMAAQAGENRTVYVTNTGKKYHRESCHHLRQSKIPMKLREARKYYDPCKVCRPPA